MRGGRSKHNFHDAKTRKRQGFDEGAPPLREGRTRLLRAYLALIQEQSVSRRTVLMVNDPGHVLVWDSVGDIHHPTFNRAISQYWHSPQPFRVICPGRARTDGKTACLMAWTQPSESSVLRGTSA